MAAALSLCGCHHHHHDHDHGHATEEASEAAVAQSGGVAFPEAMRKRVDFSTAPCRIAPMGQVIRAMAQVQPSQGEEQIVTAKASGIVTLASQLTVGSTVAAGQPLCHIESSGLAEGDMALRMTEAENAYETAKADYERKLALSEHKIVSDNDLQLSRAAYESARVAYENLARHFSGGKQTLAAPFSGYVKQLCVANGAFVEAGQAIAIVSQNKQLFIQADIQAKHYHLLKEIASVNFRTASGEVYALSDLGGKLVSYGKAVTAASSLIPVVFSVNNTVDLLPGTFVEAFIVTQGTAAVIALPNEALLEEMGNYFVYVERATDYFEKQQVKIGVSDGAFTEVTWGLAGTERVAARGAVLVKLAHAAGTIDAHAGHVH